MTLMLIETKSSASMTFIPDHLREAVAERAQYTCEYCQTQKDVVIFMVVDHIIPSSLGGPTALENLCYACPTCNNFKHDFQSGYDPETNETVDLYNPRQERWSEYFQWSADSLRVVGLTPIGRATITRLKMNMDEVIASRQRWVSVGWHPPKLEDPSS